MARLMNEATKEELAMNIKLAQVLGNPISPSNFTILLNKIESFKRQENNIGCFHLSDYTPAPDFEREVPRTIQVKPPSLNSTTYCWPVLDPIKQVIKTNLVMRVKNRQNHARTPFGRSIKPAEQHARNVLRDMLSEKEWRRYVTNNFIMVKGTSGNWYQIFAYNERVRVYQNNTLTHYICIHTDKIVPPTDHVLNIKMLVEMNENLIWQEGRVSEKGAFEQYGIPALKIEKLNLLDCFKRYRAYG